MAARKYTRVSDTGIVLHVSRSLSYGGSVGLNGTPNTTDAFLLETEFSRSYADTNYTPPAEFSGAGDKDYNRAGTYFDADSRKAISSFYTTFGSEPVVDVVRVDSAGRYRSTVPKSNRLADSRLSKDVFGDPMFYASEPNLFASIVEGTDSDGTVVYDDPRYIVSFSGINPEFSQDTVVGTATDDVTANVHSQVLSQLVQVTGSFTHPSDGLALVDGGHLYRSFMADTRARLQPAPGTIIGNPLGQADMSFSRGISALGLLPKTEVFEIPANNADFVQYPGKSTDRTRTSYSPRYDEVRDEFLPATGDADLRGFHGQFWISSKRFDDTFNNVNGQFTRGKANRPVPFGPKSDRRSYSADTVGGIYALDASSVPNVNIDFELNSELSIERGKFVYDPVFNESTLMPDITGSTTRNPDRVQDYRSLLMAATFVSSSLSYPLTSADLYTAIEEPMVEKLRTVTDSNAFTTIKLAVQTGLSEVTHDLFDDEYPYVRHLIALTAGDAYYANFDGMLVSEVNQPSPEVIPIANNLTDYIDPGLMPFSNPEGVLPVKLDLANPANVVLYESLMNLSPTIDYNDSSTYDFSAFTNADYASYLGMVNLGNQGSFDIIGATARMEHADVVIWATAHPQKTINKLRFSSNTVSRSAFNSGDQIVLTPDKEAAFGKIPLEDDPISGMVRATITHDTFDRFNPSLPARPTKVQIGDPIRIYFGGESTLTPLPPRAEAIYLEVLGSDVTDLVLNTTEGPISLIRDVGLTRDQLKELTYFDLSDSRLTPIPAITPDGISVVLRNELVLRPQVESIDLVTTKNVANLALKYIILHHLQEFNFKHEYFNNAGHVAHSMYRDPISTIRIGTKQNPSRDPGFIQSEGGAAAARLSSFGYPLDQNTIPVVRQEGVANVDVQVYNPMFGVPDILRGQVQNSIYEFDTSHDVNYRTGKVPFMRQGFVYNEDVTVELNEETANLEAMGYAQVGEVPRQGLTPARYTYKTDLFGRARIFGIPSEESPVFDSNGRIGLMYGGDVKVVVPKNNGQQFPGHPYPYDRTESKVLPIALLAGYENSEGIQIVLKNRAPAGLLPVDQERVGVAFRTILANPSDGVVELQRTTKPSDTTDVLPSPASMTQMAIMTDTSLYQDDSSLLFADGMSKPPKEFRHIPLTIEWSDKDGTRYQVERDNGVINYNDESNGTKTSNLLHPRNSKVGAGYNGVFYYGEDNQAQMMFNYMYVDLLPESLGTIRYPGFFTKTVRAGALDPEKFNALTVVRDPIQPVPNRSAISNAQETTVRISPSAYTLSDNGTHAAINAAANVPMPANNHGSISAMVGMKNDNMTHAGYVINERFLNFPIRAASYMAYENRLYNNDINVVRPLPATPLTSYIYGQDYANRRFGVDAKMLNYALGPADLFFGSATVNEGDVRQITKVMDFGIELAEYVEYPTQTEATTPNYVNVNSTTVLNSALPPGTYSFIFNIQDMLIPGEPRKEDPLALFTPTNENGLRSNFYWNLPASTINEGLFSESPTYTRSASMVSAIGYVTGTTDDGMTVSEVRGNLRITIQPAEDFTISPLSEPFVTEYKGVTCDKGILYPDPTNRDIGTNGMQVEGSPTEQGPNGEFRQAYKVVRVDVYTDVAIPWRKLQNVAGLAVSFRPNSTIPSEFLVPTSTDGMNADRYTLYGIPTNPKIPRGEYPCFARIGSVAFYHSLYPNALSMFSSVPIIGPKYINGLPGDSFDHLPGKRAVQVTAGASPTQATGLSFTELCVNTTPTPDEIYTVKTMLGFHAVVAPGEISAELDLPTNALVDNVCQAVNRSILDMGCGLNIINLAGVATQGNFDIPVLRRQNPVQVGTFIGGNA